MLCVIVL